MPSSVGILGYWTKTISARTKWLSAEVYSINAFNGDGGMALLIPGLRFSRRYNRAFQIGFAGIIADGEVQSVPIHMLGWFMKI